MAKHTLQVLFENAGINVRSYSGRGMMGKKCLGVTVSDIPTFTADVLEYINNDEHHLEGLTTNLETFTRALRSVRSDSMGKGMVLYFPNVSFFGDDEGEGDEEDEFPIV